MKISASVYSANKNLTELIQELDQYDVDYFHIDCRDDISVFKDIEQIRSISNTPVDLHLITATPEKYYDLIREHRIEKVTFQYENLPENVTFPFFPDAETGLAITSDTPIEVFNNFKEQCSFILMMTTVPGESGGKFNKDNFRKIRHFRNSFPWKQIHVDGGVNDEVSFILRNLGVDLVVSGSFLVNAPSVKGALMDLRYKETPSGYQIADFMVNSRNTPVIEQNGTLSLKSLLKNIEDYNLGFTILTKSNQQLNGIVTNADVRRGLLKNIDNLNSPNIKDFINNDPVFINQNKSTEELLKLIKSLPFPLLYLPVVNDNQQVVGCLTFNNLIKGET